MNLQTCDIIDSFRRETESVVVQDSATQHDEQIGSKFWGFQSHFTEVKRDWDSQGR